MVEEERKRGNEERGKRKKTEKREGLRRDEHGKVHQMIR